MTRTPTTDARVEPRLDLPNLAVHGLWAAWLVWNHAVLHNQTDVSPISPVWAARVATHVGHEDAAHSSASA